MNEFSVADAVIASMSFPGVTEPVILQCYYGPRKPKGGNCLFKINIVDGGLFDNSGISSLIDFMLAQVEENKKKVKN